MMKTHELPKKLRLNRGELIFDVGNEVSTDEMNCRAGLANHLRNMPHSDFLSLIREIYRSMLNGIEGLQTQGRIIVEFLETIRLVICNIPIQRFSQTLAHFICIVYRSVSRSLDIPALHEEFSDIVSSAAELSNTRAAKVISMRSEQHAALDLPSFLSFFKDSWNFVVKCEVISRRMIVGLRGVVVGQVGF